MAAVAKRIMVGYDGAEPARRALDRAAELAGYGATVTVVRVANSGGEDDSLSEARDRLAGRHVRARVVERFGEPAETLVEIATAEDADLLIVGSRNRNGLARLALGSVSGRVVRDAPCDVLVVR
jgi:nucleotide-binding universal stress UspA family protein